MTSSLRLLLVEDSADDAALLARALERGGYPAEVTRVEDREGLERALAERRWDLVISDHTLPRLDSATAIRTLRAVDADVGCIIVSGNLGEEAAVEAMRSGADDYVLKDRLHMLPSAVGRALRTAEARRERHRAEGRYRSLVEGAPNGIVTIDRSGAITSVNPAFTRLTGLDDAEARGRHFRDWVYPEDADRLEAKIPEALADPDPRQTQVRVLAKGGIYFYADLTVSRLVEGGEVVGLFAIVRDITERRSMERELRRNEAHLRTLVDHAPDGIYTLAPTGEVTSLNAALMKLLDLDFTLVGRRFREVVYPEDLGKAADHFSRRLAGETIPPYEIRLARPDGTPVPVEITSSTLTDGGKVSGTLGIVRDISVRKATEQELALREERFRLVTMATQDAVYDWDLVKNTIWWNERAATLFGVAPPAAAGEEWWAAQMHPEDRERVIGGFDRAAAEHRALWTDEYRVRHAGGGWRVLIDMGMYLYDEAGKAIRMIGALSDITERREGELEQLRLQTALQGAATDWTATFDAVPMLVLLVDEEGRLRRVNRTARDLAGGAWGNLLDHSINDLQGSPWEHAAALFRTALATSVPMGDQFEDPSGRAWNLAAAPVVTSAGKQVVLILRDITDMVHLQRTLGHQRTMAALGALVAGVAHEVRNPLFAISATLDAFEAKFGSEPEFQKYTTNLRPELQRLSALMRDLLEYGRPAELQPVEGDLLAVVREAAGRSESVGAARGVRFEIRADQAPARVRHDPARMLQVVQNLLDNALVHAPAESTITVTLAQMSGPDHAWCRLTVADQGHGFREDDLPHVFEPFYSRRRGGTGLGLSIVERLVGQHGGRVIAANRPEGGAAVTVLLPLTP